jgi:hypothetical protein
VLAGMMAIEIAFAKGTVVPRHLREVLDLVPQLFADEK